MNNRSKPDGWLFTPKEKQNSLLESQQNLSQQPLMEIGNQSRFADWVNAQQEGLYEAISSQLQTALTFDQELEQLRREVEMKENDPTQNIYLEQNTPINDFYQPIEVFRSQPKMV